MTHKPSKAELSLRILEQLSHCHRSYSKETDAKVEALRLRAIDVLLGSLGEEKK